MALNNPEHAYLLRRFGEQVRIRFQGWKSTLGELMYCGWNVYSEVLHYEYATRLIFSNEDIGLVGMTDDMNIMHRQAYHDIVINRMTPPRNTMIRTQERPIYRSMSLGFASHMEDILISHTVYDQSFCLADILQPVDVEKLIVAREDEKTVDDLLKHILSKQSNLREEIAQRRVKENLIEKPSAQIVKLFAA